MAITYKTFKKVFIKEINSEIEMLIEKFGIPEDTYASIRTNSAKNKEEMLFIECELYGETISVKSPMDYLFHLYDAHDISIKIIVFYTMKNYIDAMQEICAEFEEDN